MRNIESKLQMGCVLWFRYAYPQYNLNLFSVPNGGYRTKTTAVTMQREGVISGVSDLLLLLPSKEYSGLCLEIKIKPNKQSINQKNWEEHITKFGYKYQLIYTLEQFQDEITRYITLAN